MKYLSSLAHPWLILGSLIWVSIPLCFCQEGVVGMSSMTFKPFTSGFVDYIHDITERSYDHESDIGNTYGHHAYYEFDRFRSFTTGTPRVVRPMDGNIAPAVVYESDSKPWIGATFYAKCEDDIRITPTWTFTAGGIDYEMKFPTQTITPQPLAGSASGDEPDFIAYYDFAESDISFPQGFTLAFETATIEFRITDAPSGLNPSTFSTVLTADADVYVVANPIQTPQFSQLHALRARYSSIRNGCFYGNDTNDYHDWIIQMFDGYFAPLNARRGKNGIKLEYWKRDGYVDCTNLKEFFLTGSGKCNLFSSYLAEIIICQGYPFNRNTNETLIEPKGIYGATQSITTSEEAHINDAIFDAYGFGSEIVTDNPVIVFAVIRESPFIEYVAYPIARTGVFFDLQDYSILSISAGGQAAMIVKGQNNDTYFPRHLFKNHVYHYSEPTFSAAGLEYKYVLDPSYGYRTSHLSILPGLDGTSQIEDASIHIVRSVLLEVEDINGIVYSCIVPININVNNVRDLTQY